MAMRCPRCSTPPPADPFICAACGERLLTYLGEPFGPGTGVATGAPAGGAVGAAPAGMPLPSGTPGGPYPPGPYGPPPAPPAAPRRSDGPGPLIARLLVGLFATLVMLAWEPVDGLLMLGVLALLIWRGRRMHFALYMLVVVGAMIAIAMLVESIDELDFAPPPPPTPTPDRAATSTAIAVQGTPTLPPAARTATATAVAAENRQRIARARVRWLRGDNAAALAELDQALRIQPESTDALNLRALVRGAAGDLQGASEDAEKAVTIQPSSGTFHDTQGYAFLKQGRYAEAREVYAHALRTLRGTDRTATLLGHGLALTALGQLADARADLDEGLRLVPDSDPDPQLADLEPAARRALDPLAPRPGSPSPAASPAAIRPATAPETTPGPRAYDVLRDHRSTSTHARRRMLPDVLSCFSANVEALEWAL
jgi:Tfp pilus assembly protein PilF